MSVFYEKDGGVGEKGGVVIEYFFWDKKYDKNFIWLVFLVVIV